MNDTLTTLPPESQESSLHINIGNDASGSTDSYTLSMNSEQPTGENYVILFGGGREADSNDGTFYYDIKSRYETLTTLYNIPKDHIYILYADGLDPGIDRTLLTTKEQVNSDMSFAWGSHVYTSSEDDFQSVVNTLAGITDENDHLFVSVSTHGWHGYSNTDPSILGNEGFTGWGGGIFGEDYNEMMSEIDAGYQTHLFGQCYSGGVLEALDIIDDPTKKIYAAASAQYDELSWYWYNPNTGTPTAGFGYGVNEALKDGITNSGEWAHYLVDSNNDDRQHPYEAGDTDFEIFAQVGEGMDIYESDNTYQEATLLVQNQTQDHNLHSSTDVDWFKFVVTTKDDFAFEIESTGEISFSLYNSSHTLIQSTGIGTVDGGDYIGYTLSAGTYYFNITSYNQTAVESYTIQAYEFEDVIDPEVTLNTPTITKVSDGRISVTFSWNSSEKASYQLFIDGKVYSTTGTKYTLQLDDGYHSYSVVATDQSGNEGSASGNFSYDATAPTVTLQQPTISNLGEGRNEVTFSWNSDGATSYELIINNETVYEGTGTSHTMQLNDGTYSYSIIASDSQGNERSVNDSLSLDTTAPELTITRFSVTKVSNNRISLDMAWSSNEAGTSYKLFIDGVERPITGTSCKLELSSGQHSYVLVGTDKGGNETSVSDSFEYDATAPSIILYKPSISKVSDGRIAVTFSWYSNETATYKLIVDNKTYTLTERTLTLELDDDVDSYTLIATDKQGNESRREGSVDYDATAPVLKLSKPVITKTGEGRISVKFQWSCNETAQYALTVDGVTYPVSGTNHTLELSDGKHEYSITATDNSGNSTTVSDSFEADATAPAVTLLTPVVEKYSEGRISVTFSWQSESDALHTLNINGKNYSVKGNTHTLILNDGVHNYSISAKDKAGNIGTASDSFSYDASAPDVSLEKPFVSKDEYGNINTLFEWTSDEAASYILTVNGQNYQVTGTSHSLILGEGRHQYSVTATDTSGNQSIESGSFTITPTSFIINKTIERNTAQTIDSMRDLQKLNVAAGSKVSGVQEYTSLHVTGYAIGTNLADRYTFGSYTQTTLDGDISLLDGNDSIIIGTYSTFDASNIDFGTSQDNKYLTNVLTIGTATEFTSGALSNLARITLSSGKIYKGDITYTTFESQDITGTVKNDSYSFGNYTHTRIFGNISLYDGNDSLKIGSYSYFSADGIDFGTSAENRYLSNALTVGAASEFHAGLLSNLARITVSAARVGSFTSFDADAITGTVKNDSYSFGNYTKTTIKGDMSLYDGNDSIRIGSYSEFTVGDIDFGTSVENKYLSNSLTVGAASEFTGGTLSNLARITVSAARVGSFTSFDAEAITGTVKNDSYSFGNYTKTTIKGDMSLYDGNDSIRIGSYSEFTVGNIDFGTSVDDKYLTNSLTVGAASEFTGGTLSNLARITVSAARVGSFTSFDAEAITGTVKNDSYSFGNYTKTTITDDIALDAGNDSLKIGNYSFLGAEEINLGTGTNSLSIGASSEVKLSGSLILAENMPSDIKLDKSKLSLGAASSLIISEDLAGLSSLTVTSGKKIRDLSEESGYRYEHSILSVEGEVTGTANNDSYRLGSFTQIHIHALDMGEGTDSLILGSDSELVINATSVEKLSIGKNNIAYLNSELISMLSEKALAENTIYDIGSYSDASILSLSEQKASATLYQPATYHQASYSDMETQLNLVAGSGMNTWASSHSAASPLQTSYDLSQPFNQDQEKNSSYLA